MEGSVDIKFITAVKTLPLITSMIAFFSPDDTRTQEHGVPGNFVPGNLLSSGQNSTYHLFLVDSKINV